MKILLYLESHQRYKRASSPDKLGREIGIGGYDTVKGSYVYLSDHGYVAPAPGAKAPTSEITDPNELVVTPQGRKALMPYLGTYSSWEMVGVSLSAMGLGLGLGAIMIIFQPYPSLLWLMVLLGVMVAASMAILVVVVLAIGRYRYRRRVASLIESITDRG